PNLQRTGPTMHHLAMICCRNGTVLMSRGTNIDGAFFPFEFELVTYRPAVGPPGHENSPIAATYHGQVVHCGTSSLEIGLPDISLKPISVSDLRFRDKMRPLDAIH